MTAALGDRLLVPMGFEYGARDPVFAARAQAMFMERTVRQSSLRSHRYDQAGERFSGAESGRFAGGAWQVASASGWTAWAVSAPIGRGA